MLREYLRLARLPNAFTSPTNIMAGYFISNPLSHLNPANLALLMASSALLYVSGIVFNDYFDIETDRKERQFRPLPAGTIPRKRAFKIAVALMASGLALSLFVSWTSFAVAAFLSSLILAYDFRLKRNKVLNPLAMGGARFLNVILGASTALQLPQQGSFSTLVFAALCMMAYVAVIALLSRREITGIASKIHLVSLLFANYAILGSIAVAILLGAFKQTGFIILIPFFLIITLIFRRALVGQASDIQSGIKNMVIAIIILDSVFVSGTAGLQFGLAAMLFLIPAIVLSKKLYVT